MPPDDEREFLVRLAAIWLACRLAAFGGTPLIPQHKPVRCVRTLEWALLGCTDYGEEMRLLAAEHLERLGSGQER
jgi:hypothetical protein